MESKKLCQKFVDGAPYKPKQLFKDVQKSNEMCQNIRVMTYNIANFMDHKNWSERCKQMAAEIEAEKPDFIGLQEVRFCYLFYGGRNALRDLFKHMKTPYYVLFKSAMVHKGTLDIKFCEEGLAILSRHPFIDYQWESLPDAVKDKNKRIALTGFFQVPVADQLSTPVSFTVTHLTYEGSCSQIQCEALKKTLDKSWSQQTCSQIVVGDFNLFEKSTPKCFLTDDPSIPSKFATCPDQPTFPAWKPRFLFDRILFRGSGLKLQQHKIQEKCGSKQEMISDHLYVTADFELCLSST